MLCEDLLSYGFDNCLNSSAATDIVIDNRNVTSPSFTLIAPQNKLNIVTIVYSSLHKNIATINSSNNILALCYPAMEPSPSEHVKILFQRRFGILVDNKNRIWSRCISNLELL